jgi:hypothetical protein
VAGDTNSPESWRELPRAYANVAEACRVLGRKQEARRWYRTALAEWDKMSAQGVFMPDSQAEIQEIRRNAGMPAEVAAHAGR